MDAPRLFPGPLREPYSMRYGQPVRNLILVGLVVTALTTPAEAAIPPRAVDSAAISVTYSKRVIRHYINDKYVVAIGPNFGACTRLASNNVRCEVEFKAGLYWRCGRVSVRNSGGYDYIAARLPIGC